MPPSTPQHDPAKPTILVAEDDSLLRRMAVETLCDDGLCACGVDSGLAALDRLRAEPGIRLLITDINMPGMDGFALLASVEGEHPHVRRMVVSGRAHLRSDTLPPGTEILAKPFTAGQFLTRVRHVLGQPAGTAQDAKR